MMMIKLRNMRSVGRVAGMGTMRCLQNYSGKKYGEILLVETDVGGKITSK
jgi:hypothetical protein